MRFMSSAVIRVTFATLVCPFCVVSTVGFAAGSQPDDERSSSPSDADARAAQATMPAKGRAANDEASDQASTDAQLERVARLDTVLRVALIRNPGIAEDHARVRVAEARGRVATGLPDTQLKYEQWGVPLARPHELGQADALMLGVRQTLPAWGTLTAGGRAAEEETGGAREAVRTRRQDVAAQVHRTFADYFRSDRELGLHLEHLGLTARVIELAKLNQRTAHGSLQDVLRLQLELTRLHTDVARIERDRRTSRARLNALMGRALDAALGPPEDLVVVASAAPVAPVVGAADVAAIDKRVEAARPEIAAAKHSLRRAEYSLDGIRRAARIPEVMVGLDYWYLPMGTDFRHGYGAMVAINLPWLSGRRQSELAAAERNIEAERRALESTRNTVRYELREAAARMDAARESFTIIDQELLAQAQRSLEATQAAYAAGQGDALGLLDALRSYLQVRIERVQALADLSASQAEVRRAAGALAVEMDAGSAK